MGRWQRQGPREENTTEKEREREKVLRTRHNLLLKLEVAVSATWQVIKSKKDKSWVKERNYSTIYAETIKLQVHSGFWVFRCLLNALLLPFREPVSTLLNSRSRTCAALDAQAGLHTLRRHYQHNVARGWLEMNVGIQKTMKTVLQMAGILS